MMSGKMEKIIPIIGMEGITKSYNEGKSNEIQILFDIDLKIYKGEFVAIVGESGSGKSTLMNIIGILDRQSSGMYLLENQDTNSMDDKQMSYIRNKKIGFVFQNFNLIARTTAIDNVILPMIYAGKSKKESIERAKELLDMVGVFERKEHYPNQLSGGQQQRVAIARAMANEPSIILADEPTGALDSKTSGLVMDIFNKLNNDMKKSIVLITHSKDVANESKRIIKIADGRIVFSGGDKGAQIRL